jgi:hypothetical protein
LNGEATSECADAVLMMRPHLRLHAGDRGADRVKGRGQVDGDDLVPFLDGEILDRRDELDAGVVDENIDGAQRLFRIGDHGGDLGRLRHVGGVVEAFHAEILLDAGALLLDRVLVAEAVDDDIGALLGEGAGIGEADA